MKFILIHVFIGVASFWLVTTSNPLNEEWSADDHRWDTLLPNWWDIPNFTPPRGPPQENNKDFWFSQSQNLLTQKLNQKLNEKRAKNIILFIGDGMGLSTTTATRAYIKDASHELSFEKFPHSGHSKVYCTNYQVPESSSTATALLSGVKTNFMVLGLAAAVNLRNCSASKNPEWQVPSFFKYAQDSGKSTGVVTTARITHATPAAAYATAASRNWESSAPDDCEDIAMQLINGKIGKNLDVILGGGSTYLLPTERGGYRTDGRNLLSEFLENKKQQRKRPVLAINRNELMAINASDTDSLLGMFAGDHMEFKVLADSITQPTLEEMTAKAIDILSKNEKNGYVLMVEGGRIDAGHHQNRAKLALEETVEFNKAVEYAAKNTNEEDTLIVVTADHSHPFTISGYMPRHRNVLGPSDFSREDDMWIFGPTYSQGQGHAEHFSDGVRRNPRGSNYMNSMFRQPALAPLHEGTHSAEDVGVYARGPWSHLFTGVYEQTFVAHGIMYAGCLGPQNAPKHSNC